MEFEEKVKALLEKWAISVQEISLESTTTGRIGGFLVSEAFKGIEQVKRQEELWKYLEQNLPEEDLVNIISILTLTPEEVLAAS